MAKIAFIDHWEWLVQKSGFVGCTDSLLKILMAENSTSNNEKEILIIVKQSENFYSWFRPLFYWLEVIIKNKSRHSSPIEHPPTPLLTKGRRGRTKCNWNFETDASSGFKGVAAGNVDVDEATGIENTKIAVAQCQIGEQVAKLQTPVFFYFVGAGLW